MLIPWMIQHAVGTLNRYRMGREKDGRTPYHRVKGRKFNQVVAEFGECMWYLKQNLKESTRETSVGKKASGWVSEIELEKHWWEPQMVL